MAASQRRKSASTNKRGAAVGDVDAAIARYLADLERAPLAAPTRDAYGQHVRAYGAWLGGRPAPALAIGDPRGRDYAARDFKRNLKVDRGWKPSSVNLALAAVDHFNRFLGLGPANVNREPLAQAAPRALSTEKQRALLRAAELARPRDGTIVTLLLYTAFRLHELAALDVEDVSISRRARALWWSVPGRGRVPGGAAQPAIPGRAGRMAQDGVAPSSSRNPTLSVCRHSLMTERLPAD